MPSVTVWVCVCVTLGVIGMLLHLFCFTAGGARDHASLALTKTLAKTLALVCEIDLGRQIDVPAKEKPT